jgi:hypothetical protein
MIRLHHTHRAMATFIIVMWQCSSSCGNLMCMVLDSDCVKMKRGLIYEANHLHHPQIFITHHLDSLQLPSPDPNRRGNIRQGESLDCESCPYAFPRTHPNQIIRRDQNFANIRNLHRNFKAADSQ